MDRRPKKRLAAVQDDLAIAEEEWKWIGGFLLVANSETHLLGVEPKIEVYNSPKMDGENNGKPI